MTESTKKAAIYCRVSTEEQEREGTSLDTQLEACKKLADTEGYQVVNEYQEAYSGLELMRPKLEEMRELVRGNQIDIIIIYALDRLTRDPEDGVILRREFEKNNVTLVAVTEDIDTSELGKLINYIKGYAANIEARKIAERTSRGRCAKAQKPDYNYAGGYIGFGYTMEKYLDGDKYKNRIVVNEVEAATVRKIFDLYNSNWTTGQIAVWLHKQRIPTKTSKTWTRSTVAYVLKNQTYVGKGRNAGVESPRPRIVGDTEFAQVQMRLSKNRRRAGAPSKVTYMLKGLGKCGVCGGNLLMREVTGKRYIHCVRQHMAPHKYQCFNPKHFSLTAVENFVWAEIVDFLDSFKKGDLADKLWDNYEVSKGHREAVITQARVELEKIQNKKQRLLSEYVDGIFNKEQVDMKNRQLTDEQEHWQTVVDEQLTLTDNVRVDELMASLNQLDDLYDWGLMGITPEKKKEIIASVLEGFVIYPNELPNNYYLKYKVELQYNLPVTQEQIAELFDVSGYVC